VQLLREPHSAQSFTQAALSGHFGIRTMIPRCLCLLEDLQTGQKPGPHYFCRSSASILAGGFTLIYLLLKIFFTRKVLTPPGIPLD